MSKNAPPPKKSQIFSLNDIANGFRNIIFFLVLFMRYVLAQNDVFLNTLLTNYKRTRENWFSPYHRILHSYNMAFFGGPYSRDESSMAPLHYRLLILLNLGIMISHQTFLNQQGPDTKLYNCNFLEKILYPIPSSCWLQWNSIFLKNKFLS